MLNKKVCKKCFVRINKEQNVFIPRKWLLENFEDNWENHSVIRCPMCSNFEIEIIMDAGDGFLKRCPYVLEHIVEEGMTNAK